MKRSALARRAPPRWIAAAAASAAIHATAGLALWLDRAPPAPRSRPIEIVMVEVRAPPASTAPPAPLASPGPPVPLAPPVAPAAPVAAVQPDAAVPREAAVPRDDAVPPDLGWAVAPAGAGTGRADLSVHPPPPAATLHAPSDPTPAERLDRLLRGDAGRAAVARGLADPYYTELGRAVARAWQPESIVTERGLAGYAAGLGRSLVDGAAVYLAQAERYGRTGSPVAPDALPRDLTRMNALPEGALGADVTRQSDVRRLLEEDSRRLTRRAATVRIVQGPDGRLLLAELVGSSNDAAVDAQALRDIRAVGERLPPPTPGALAGRGVVASLWELELEVSISPPLPVVAVQFDEVLGVADARVPLDRRLHKRVRLVAVE